MIEMINVTKDYGTSGQAGYVQVLKGVSLKVREGQMLAIGGPSGCGKSTLLNLMGALDRPTSGQVLWEGKDLAQRADPDLARFRNKQIGWVFQLHHLLPQCTALENCLIPTLAMGNSGPRGAVRDRARDLLEKVGLADQMSRRPGELSGGQCQRVAVARALINEPRLLLADEPTGSLDERTADGIADLFVELNRHQGLALVVVTHASRIAARMGQVLELHEGLLAQGVMP